jgi:transcription-repair coupling factor (superfamily II helicase)
MLGFMDGQFDVLVATSIIESGIDVPNANTMIIYDAHMFGLSDLHQLRGRVGRSNRKAFCYLFTPPVQHLSTEARKRLHAIEQFSHLGSGFNIAMRDLDIRGAGNLLGAEQSGFINDIGIEMYQKILDEALTELKQTEFSDLFPESALFQTEDCQIETDLDIKIPDDYVNVVAERLQLYRGLDEVEDEEHLLKKKEELEDRFGPIPEPLVNLFQSLRMRWVARKIGFGKIIIKSGKMLAYFAAREDQNYYQGATFGKVLKFVQAHQQEVTLSQKNDRLRLLSDKNNLDDVIYLFEKIIDETT